MPEEFDKADAELSQAVAKMGESLLGQLDDETLNPERRKVLQSLKVHWDGLMIIRVNKNCSEAAYVLEGYISTKLTVYERIICLILVPILFYEDVRLNIVGMVIFLTLVVFSRAAKKRRFVETKTREPCNRGL